MVAILTPARSHAAAGGDLLSLSRSRKTTHVNLSFARLIRAVGDPLTIGRKTGTLLVKVGFGEREGLTVTRYRQYPEIACFVGIRLSKEQEAAVGRPVGRQFVAIVLQQCLPLA